MSVLDCVKFMRIFQPLMLITAANLNSIVFAELELKKENFFELELDLTDQNSFQVCLMKRLTVRGANSIVFAELETKFF